MNIMMKPSLLHFGNSFKRYMFGFIMTTDIVEDISSFDELILVW